MECSILYVFGTIFIIKLLDFVVHSQKVSYKFASYDFIVITIREAEEDLFDRYRD